MQLCTTILPLFSSTQFLIKTLILSNEQKNVSRIGISDQKMETISPMLGNRVAPIDVTVRQEPIQGNAFDKKVKTKY